MSSSLYLLDLHRHLIPAPTSFEDLESAREALQAKAEGKNLRFIEFALKFEEKFPPLIASTSRSPLDQAKGIRSAAWHFDLPPIDTMLAYRAAVKIATSLNLVAYDAELGVGFLPGGRVIPEAFAQGLAPSPDDTLRGDSEVREVLAPALAQALASHGFVLEPEEARGQVSCIILNRTLGPVRQQLSIGLYRYEEISIALEVQHDTCAAVYQAALNQDTYLPLAFDLGCWFFAQTPDSNHRWYLERRQELGPILEMVRDKLLPLADLCCDLSGLDQILNDDSADTIRTPYKNAYSWQGRPASSDGSRSVKDEVLTRPQRLVIAHLNGNPSASRIANWFDEYFSPNKPARYREEYLKLRETLATTAPLATWPDGHVYRASMRPIPPSLQQAVIDARARRCHHWEITEELNQALSKDSTQFWERFANPDGPAELQRLWNEKADTLPLPERIASTGLGCQVRTIVRPAQEDIQVLLLAFPPIRGLAEIAILALARVGATYRMYKMGYEDFLNKDAVQPCMVFREGAGNVRRELPDLLSVEKFLDFVRDTFQ